MKARIFLLLLIALIGFITGQFSTGEKIDFLIQKTSGKTGTKNGAWKTFIGIAEDDQPALKRSVIARAGLGANTNEEAMYMSASEDINGDPLVSNRNYRITIPADMNVHEFWSLTVYGNDHFLCHNEAGKYAVSSFHKLLKNEDGTIIIYVGQQEIEPISNWLPTSIAKEPISLTLRCYNPTSKMLNEIESVSLPVIEPLL